MAALRVIDPEPSMLAPEPKQHPQELFPEECLLRTAKAIPKPQHETHWRLKAKPSAETRNRKHPKPERTESLTFSPTKALNLPPCHALLVLRGIPGITSCGGPAYTARQAWGLGLRV